MHDRDNEDEELDKVVLLVALSFFAFGFCIVAFSIRNVEQGDVPTEKKTEAK
jgi:hypothetical protein